MFTWARLTFSTALALCCCILGEETTMRMISGIKLRFGSEISQSFGVCKAKNVLLPVVEVRQESRSDVDLSFLHVLARSGIWVFIQPRTCLFSCSPGHEGMEGLRGRGIYFINKWRGFNIFFFF